IISNKLQLFEAERLELVYDKTISIRQTTVHVVDNHSIYTTTPWNSFMVMMDLPGKLCEALLLQNFENEM
ncbi:unnamed protein product, partial [Didymodactylos carnosus]